MMTFCWHPHDIILVNNIRTHYNSTKSSISTHIWPLWIHWITTNRSCWWWTHQSLIEEEECVWKLVCAVRACLYTVLYIQYACMNPGICLCVYSMSVLLVQVRMHSTINYFSCVHRRVHVCVWVLCMYKHVANIISSTHMHGCVQSTSVWVCGVCLNMCVLGCCRQVEDCLPPEGLSLPAACGNHGALPGYKPLVCTDKKTWRAKINYLQADPCTPRLAWHFSCIKCHYLWSHPIYCLFYWSTV